MSHRASWPPVCPAHSSPNVEMEPIPRGTGSSNPSPSSEESSANGKWRRPAPPSFNVEQQLPEVDVGAAGTAHSVLPSIEPKKARHIYLSRPSRNQTGFRTSSTLGRTGYFWMICRFTSARIFPQRECKLNEPNGFEPLRPADDRIIRVFWPINFAHNR